MVQNNKVLTVSYGTFSCTLEGFDDSFDTMKAIAEYFRDLAADDRYFGAEPPQPDADMLARIAQREISRQVEAHTDAKGIVLRAAEAAPVTAPAAAAPVAPPAAAAVVEAQPEPTPAPVVEPEVAPVEAAPVAEAEPEEAPAVAEKSPDDAPAAEAVEEVVEEVSAEEPTEAPRSEETPVEAPVAGINAEASVAEIAEDTVQDDDAEEMDDQREEEPVAEAQPEADDQQDDVELEAVADEAPITAEVEDAPKVEIEDAADEDTADEVAEAVTDTADDNDEDAALAAIAARVADPEADVPVVEAEPVEKDDTVPAADSIAAKLQRIRAVVSRNEKAAKTETYAEDEHAEDVVTAAASGLNAALQADDEAKAEEEEEDDVSAILGKLDAEEEVEADGAAQEDALFSDLDDDADDAEDELDNILSSDEPAEKPAHPKARVLKVKRSDLEAAIAAGELQAADDDSDADDVEVEAAQDDAASGSSLLPEDEADLMRELAAVEAELNAQSKDEEDELPSMEAAPEKMAQDATEAQEAEFDDGDDNAEDPAIVPVAVSQDDAPKLEADDDDLSRLMATADEKLDDPDTSSSREAYTHLRAAVAAAHAERSAGGTVGTHTSDDDYREDLASVVRPRRPTAKASSPRPRAGGERPAPLKLVAEQRIDVPSESQNRGAVRPRRVASVVADETTGETGKGFAEYASEKGAVTLPDLLEAAAAYMSFVEGREQFSRPQLMNKVRQLDNQSFNREDGLRSFGQLLRDGKIEKAGGGRFVASGDIGFHPNKRAAG